MGRLRDRSVRWILALGVCAGVSAYAPRAAVAQDEDMPRLRTVDPRLAALIQQGQELSPTLRLLADGIQNSDLVVYVERHGRFRNGETASFQLVGTFGGQRYGRVALSSLLNQREILVLLAHELQHANELAAAPHVVDQSGMRQFYYAIGYRRLNGYETAAAQRAALQVATELATHPDR